MKRKIAVLSLTMIVGMSSLAFADASLANIKNVKVYNSTFTDVRSSDWFLDGVKFSYQAGLIGGKSNGKFDPNGNLTIAEAVTIASKLHNLYQGGDGKIAPAGSNWYDGAVKYAVDMDIIKSNDFKNYNAKISRAQMAYIFASVIDSKDLAELRTVSELPDVKSSTPYSSSILQLVRAGVIGGSDQYGTFNPNSQITRAETAAIVQKLVQKEKRSSKQITVKKNSGGTKLSVDQVKAHFYYNDWDYGTAQSFVVKYGTHTYSCANQQEYDKVLQVIENWKAKHNANTYDFSQERMWNAHETVKNGGTLSPRDQASYEGWEMKPIIERFGEAKAKEFYTLNSIIGKIERDVQGTIIGESAYNYVTTGGDCNARAQIDSAVWDSVGYSTRVVYNNEHAWTQVKLDGKLWYNVSGGINLGANGITNDTFSIEAHGILTPATY